MNWISVALAGYGLNAVASVFDKFLLSEKRIGAPALYAFFTALSGLPFLSLVPFGIVLFIPAPAVFGTVSGFLFLFGLLAMYQAVKRSELSRAAPLIGSSTTLFLFVFSILFSVLSGNPFSLPDLFSLFLLVGGGALLSTGGRGIRGPGFVSSVVVSGMLFAAALVMLRESYLLSNFVTGFVWSKFGMFLGGLALLLLPTSRKDILTGRTRFSGPVTRSSTTALFFVATLLFGGTGTLLISYAVSLGSATFVQGLNGIQYGLVFVFATALSVRYPGIFREHYGFAVIARKVAALILLSLGIWLAASGGTLEAFL